MGEISLNKAVKLWKNDIEGLLTRALYISGSEEQLAKDLKLPISTVKPWYCYNVKPNFDNFLKLVQFVETF